MSSTKRNMSMRYKSRTLRRLAFVATLGATGLLVSSSAQSKKPVKVKIERSKASSKSRALQLRTWSTTEGKTGVLSIAIDTSSPVNFNAYRAQSPRRLVIDLPGCHPGKVAKRQDLDTWVSTGVRSSQVEVAGRIATRLEIELRRDVEYRVMPAKKGLRVLLSPKKAPPASYAKYRKNGARAAEIRAQDEAYAQKKANIAALQRKAHAHSKNLNLAQRELEAQRAEISRLRAEALAEKKQAQALLVAAKRAKASDSKKSRQQSAKTRELMAKAKLAQKKSLETEARARRLMQEAKRQQAQLEQNRREQQSKLAEDRTRSKHQLQKQRLAARKANQKAQALMAKAEAYYKQSEVLARAKAKEAAKLMAEARKHWEQSVAKAKRNDDKASKLLADAQKTRVLSLQQQAKVKEELRAAESVLVRARKAEKEAEEWATARQKEYQRQQRRSNQSQGDVQALALIKAQAKRAESEAELARKQSARLVREQKQLRALVQRQDRSQSQLAKSLQYKEDEISKLRSEIARAEQTIAQTGRRERKRALAEAKAKQKALELSNVALDAEVRRLGESERAAKKALASAKRRLKAEKADKRSSKQEIARAKAQLRRAMAQAGLRQRELEVRQKEFEQNKSKLLAQAQKTRIAEERVAELSRKRRALARENSAAKRDLAVAQRKLAKLEGDTTKQTKHLEGLQDKIQRAQQRLHTTLVALEDAAKKREQFAASAKQSPRRTPVGALAQVQDLRFEETPDALRIVLTTSGQPQLKRRDLSPTLQMLEIRDAKLKSEFERSFDTRAYRGPIAKISSFNDEDRVKIMVTASPDVSSSLEREGNTIAWTFPRNRDDSAQHGVWSQHDAAKVGVMSTQGSASKDTRRRSGRKKWHGERIDIELQDAPIKDVLLLFSDIGRVNIIAGNGVSGNVTMKLNSVPWDQALNIILRSLSLGMVKEGNVIRVATQSVLDDERAKAIEQANAQVQLKPLETRLVPLSYATVGEMVPKVQSVLSPRGTVTPDARTNTLIIMDVAENISLAEQLVGQLDGQTPQVLIEARIVEARTQWLRQLGIQWGFDVVASPGTGNPTGLIFPSSVGVAGGSGGGQADRRGLILPASQQNPNYAVDLPAPVGTGNGGAIGMSFGSLSGAFNTNLRLSAAEEGGEVRLISAPKIVTMDNTEAVIEQGVQIPISQVSQNGVNTRYVNATLGLQVTPHVTNEGSIILEVHVQKNEADFINTGARGDPTILTKQANSRMLIQDGDTAVIGGIYTRNQSTNRKKVPWIAEVPILGWFFKNRSEADTRTELLIFLTPKIINRSTSIGG